MITAVSALPEQVLDSDQTREMTRVFKVSGPDNGLDAMNAKDIPPYGSNYEGTTLCVVYNSANRVGAYLWEVVVKYQ